MNHARPRHTVVIALTILTASLTLAACSRGDDPLSSSAGATSTTGGPAASTSGGTAATSNTPPELVDRWVGAPRAIGALGTGTSAAFVDISDGFLILDTGNSDNPKAFGSDITVDDSGSLVLTLAGDVLDCLDGNVGQYHWSLSPKATTLTLTATHDECAARRAAIEGSWTHTACRVEGRDCLGIVEAGTYSTNRWNPYGEFTYGQATFTLPDGWAVTYDSQAALFLGSADDYAADPDPKPWGIRLWADVAAAPQDPAQCDEPITNVAPNVGTSAAAIADWMAALPTLHASRSTMTIGGLQAEVVDAKVVDGAATCDWGDVLIVSRTSKPDPFAYGISAGQQMRIILVDVLPGRTVAMFLDDQAHPGFDALAAAAMPIVKSFVFSPSPPST